ncbi:MAG TPA: GH3 auxin-responsive promoter family protein [Kofleriaceae bacterium]
MKLLWPAITVADIHASRAALERALDNPLASQWTFLDNLLKSRADTAIGRDLKLGEIHSLEDFRAKVPILEHEGIASYVKRAAAGEENVLFPGKAVHFTRTTGTTGIPKDIALGPEYRDDVLAAIGPFFSELERAYPGCLSHGLAFSGTFSEDRTPAGIAVGQPTGAARCVFAGVGIFDWAPEPVFAVTDFMLRYYTLLYWALNRDVQLLAVLSPSLATTFFTKGEELAEPLIADLEEGTFKRGPGNIDELREKIAAVAPLPGPNPEAARRLRESMAKHKRFMPREIWPNLRVISAWAHPGGQNHLDALLALCPGADLWPMHTGSSESALFVPLAQDWRGGVPTLLSTFHEFYPEDMEPEPQNFVPLDKLELGATYRALLTNGRGMFRYPITDVYRVERFYRGVPVLEFSHRHGGVSLVGEKLVEPDVVNAMKSAGALGVSLVNYQFAPLKGDRLSGYVLLLEYRDPQPSVDELATLLKRFDDALKTDTYLFGKYRVQLAPTKLALVPPGTFELLRREKTDGKRNDAQYKDAHLRKDFIDLAAMRPIHVIELPT